MINFNTTKFKKAEIIIALFSVVAIAAKFKGISGADIIIIVSLNTLAIIYFFEVTKLSKPLFSSVKLNFASKIGGWSLAIACVAIIYRLNFWRNDQTLLYTGVMGVVIAFFFFITNNTDSEEENKISNRFKIRFAIAFAILLSLLVVTKKELFTYMHKDDSEAVRLFEQMVDNPKNVEFKEAFHKYMEEKQKLKSKLNQ